MKSFTITGHVKNAENGKGIADLKVEAWDKDLVFNDLVGSAVTDAAGAFSIAFSEEHFRECLLDRLPDLFFKVYEGRRLIASTEQSVLWNIRKEEKAVLIKVDLPAKVETQSFTVKGTVRQADQGPLVGAVVRAVDKDLRREQGLGQSVADDQGYYEIHYTRSRFRRAEKKSADLIVRAFDPQTGRLLLAESPLIFNAGPVAVVDLVAAASYSEHEHYLAELAPVRENVAMEDLTTEDIGFLHGETGIAARHIEFLTLAARLGKQTGLPAGIFYGLFRQGLPTILADLLDQDADVLRKALQTAFKAHIIPLRLEENLEEDLQRLSAFKETDPGLQHKKDKETLHSLLKIDHLDEAKAKVVVEKAGHSSLVNDWLLSSMVEAGELNQAEAESVGLTTTLHRLLDDNLDLVKALKTGRFSNLAHATLGHVEELTAFDKSDWLDLLTQAGVRPPDGWSHEGYAALLAKRIEVLYPSKTLLARLTAKAAENASQDISALQPLFASNEQVFSTAFDDLDLGDLDAAGQERLRAAHTRLKGLANIFPGLSILAILDNPQASAQEKEQQIQDRIALLTRFHNQNPDMEFVFIDYSPESADVQALNFSGFSTEQQRMVLQTVKAYQRIYSVTGDSEHAQMLLAQGYHSPLQIAALGRPYFIASTGLDEAAGKAYHDKARASVARSVIGLMGVKAQIESILARFRFDNADPAVGDYLKKIDGWEALFGSLDYCNCEHCRSIFGPAAYFADLMAFLEINFYFQESGVGESVAWESVASFRAGEDHSLHLRSRRPDLWQLPLTCEHTLELVPYLDIINEVLENFIALDLGFDRERLPAPGASDRSAVENLVYATLENSAASFGQPFSLPLERLALYLAHFDLKRGDIARCLAMPAAAQAAAALNLSKRGSGASARQAYELIVETDPDLDHLRQLYGLDFAETSGRITYQPDGDTASQNDVQPLLAAMGLSRAELGQLIETRFVRTGSLELVSRIENVAIRSEKRVASGEDASVQNDIERIHGMTRIALDRMHRFTRLWRSLDWTIQELDLVLYQLTHEGLAHGLDAAGLPHLVTVRAVQERFGLAVEDACALWSGIPAVAVAPGQACLLDRLFNLPDFVRLDGRFPKPGHRYLHPAFRDTPPEEPDYTTYRLTAGLNLDDQDFYLLITGLAHSLGIDPASDHLEHKAFPLSAQHLALLYRHARLAKKLGLAVPDLFRLIALSGTPSGDHVASLNDLSALLAWYDWWQSSAYTLDELEQTTRPVEADGSVSSEAAAICQSMLKKIQADQALTFNSSVFAYLEGVTEKQSRDIVTHAGNAAFIAQARGARYQVAAGFDPEADPGAAVNLPAELSSTPDLGNDVFALLCTYNAPGAVFDDTVFAELENISPEQSRSIVAANAHLISEKPLKDTYWLTPDFLPHSELTIMAQTPVTQAKAKALLAAYAAIEVIPNYLAGEIDMDVDKVKALLDLSGADLADPEYTRALQAREADGVLVDLVKTMLPLKTLFKDPLLDAEAVGFLRSHPHLIGDLRPGALTLENTRLLVLFNRFLRAFQSTEDQRQVYYALLTAFIGPVDKFYNDPGGREAVKQALSRALGAEVGLVLTAHDELKRLEADPRLALSPPATALDALDKLGGYLAFSRRLGVSGEVLTLIVANDYDKLNQAANALLSAFRTKYDDEAKWKEKIEPFENKIRSRKRDALADYLIHALKPARFASMSDLYHYFLLDVELEGCARTSRIVAANSSVQLYVHRVLMHLEQGSDETSELVTTAEAVQEWEWRKNYRVWEANRKVFLYPENYLEPDLRDNKTPLFEELESTLLQQEINADSALDAYATYMRGFDEVARLEIAGSFHDMGDKTDTLHLLGATKDEPPVYYYRQVENLRHGEMEDDKGVIWHPWRRIEVQIPVRKLAPTVFNKQLYCFWVEIVTHLKSGVSDGTASLLGYEHKYALSYAKLRLDGSWSSPQKVSLLAGPYLPGESLTIVEGADVWTGAAEEYTLKGYNWDQVYPGITDDDALFVDGANFWLRSRIDFSKKRTIDSPFGGFRCLRNQEFNRGKALCSKFNGSRGLFFGSPTEFVFEDYAHCSIILDDSHITELFNTRTVPGYTASDFRNGLFRGERKAADLNYADELAVINGSLNDCIIDSCGDLILLQGSVRDGDRFVLRRIGTTLSARMTDRLFSRGVDGLLETRYQETQLSEAVLPIAPNPDLVEFPQLSRGPETPDPASVFELIDFEGPFGVYYREIFFHIPFLIANHLNSQGKYADAQKWYHYIYNPLAKATGTESRPQDRNWRYLEFRDRGLDSLRKQLTARNAIEVYKKDPFNPHAIARLPARLSAYQKAVVMKYIDNLLDWGDSLFAQDTMESINEATLLYILAADILGKRPAQLGDCGQASDALTYEDIGAARDEDNEFLIELHHSVQKQAQKKGKATCRYALDMAVTYTAVQKARNHVALHVYTSMPYAASGSGPGGAAASRPPAGRAEAAAHPAATQSKDDLFLGYGWKQKREGMDFQYIGPLLALGSQIGPAFCIPPNKHLMGYWDRVEDRLFKIRNCMNISGVRRELSLFAPEIDPMLLVRAKAAGLSLDDVLNSISGNLPPYRCSYLIERAKAYAAMLQGFGGALLSALEKKDVEELNQLRTIHQQNVLKMTSLVREDEYAAALEMIQSLEKRRETVECRKGYYEKLVDDGLLDQEEKQQSARTTAQYFEILSEAVNLLASIGYLVPQIGSFFALTYGGKEMGASGAMFAQWLKSGASIANTISASAGLEAGFKRREQGWQHQIDLAEKELIEIEKQIEIARLRADITERLKTIHYQTLEQQEEVYELYRDKFTNLGLYTWLATTLQSLYRQAYNNAYALAKLAEQAYRFERGNDASELIGPNHWQASRAGLMAGERLLMDLQNLECKFLEANYRTIEIDQAFSLTQIDPAALIELKQTGSCRFSIPEIYFDLFYPGHYRRKIRAARLTIPCITGPYTNVSASLKLAGSWLRNEPDVSANPLQVPLTRTVAISTSTAQNDAGVFELNFRDERYMPFEGVGALSQWELSLPKNFRQFDYNTINDVILHLSYTAEEDSNLRSEVEGALNALEGSIFEFLNDTEDPKRRLRRLFSLRQEFSSAFSSLLHSPVNQPITLKLTDKHFPIFLKGQTLSVRSAFLVLAVTKAQTVTGTQISFNAGDDPSPLELETDTMFGDLPAADITGLMSGSPLGEHNITIINAGSLAPDSLSTTDMFVIDAEKLNDIYLYIEYGL